MYIVQMLKPADASASAFESFLPEILRFPLDMELYAWSSCSNACWAVETPFSFEAVLTSAKLEAQNELRHRCVVSSPISHGLKEA